MRLSCSPLLAILTLVLSTTPALAQSPFAIGGRASKFEDVAEVSASIEPAQARPGQMVTFKLRITPLPGCWTYPANGEQASKNRIRLPKDGDLVFVDPVTDPPGAKEKPNEALGGIDKYYPNAAEWTFKAFVKPSATPGKKSVELTGSKLQACNDQNCFPSKSEPTAEFEVLAGPAVPVPPEYVSKVIGSNDATSVLPKVNPPTEKKTETTPVPAAKDDKATVTKEPVPTERYNSELTALKPNLIHGVSKLPSNNIWSFLLIAASWGLISLATPCVFPMIPITVSLFLKQGHKEPREVLQLALIYCLTIILVLGLSAFFLLFFFRELSVNPIMNVALGGLFIFFALSLFGMYDISLPNFLLSGAEKRRNAGGFVGVVFGAIAFSIVSFTCVAPFLGGFAGMISSNQFSNVQLIAGSLCFSMAFASPFFLLALFPSLLKKLPRSGSWMDTVKAVMGFLEVAAAFKFFRNAELRLLPHPEFFTYDVCIAGWIILSFACGLYLLRLYRLPHDEMEPKPVGVIQLMFALAFLGFGMYLTPALFKSENGKNQRPRGAVYAWVDAFLLPEKVEGDKDLPWSSDLTGTLALASRDPAKKFVFVDFTGVTCTNCSLNEHNVFPLPQVNGLLKKYHLVQMYTDTVPIEFYRTPVDGQLRENEATANLKFQSAAFGTEQLPLYVILEPLPDGKVRVVDVYDEGKINNIPAFVAFLSKPFESK